MLCWVLQKKNSQLNTITFSFFNFICVPLECLPFTSNLSYNLHFYECSTSFLLALTLIFWFSSYSFKCSLSGRADCTLADSNRITFANDPSCCAQTSCVTNVHANRYAMHRGKCNVCNFLLYNLQIINANHLADTPSYQCSLNTSYEANWLLWKHNRQKQAHNI